ncbi:hypothetical protein BDFB_007381 [Asbolus verrucosus]|uniref:Uncharacterized protein n=1 Tax=Asbolus verrucosus TaxID=1661398 RepID=A0A482VXN8_ASBVE|nr:hypothetical protein BDFB_007381 [Asbolus verrucosus]
MKNLNTMLHNTYLKKFDKLLMKQMLKLKKLFPLRCRPQVVRHGSIRAVHHLLHHPLQVYRLAQYRPLDTIIHGPRQTLVYHLVVLVVTREVLSFGSQHLLRTGAKNR